MSSLQSSMSAENGPYGVRVSRRTTSGLAPIFFRMQVQAHDANNLDNHIFRYAVTGKDAAGNFLLEFDGVCTPLEMEQYPASTADIPNVFPSYVRSDKGDLVYPTADVMADTWDTLTEEVTKLIDDLERLDHFEEATTAQFGDVETNDGPGPWWE